MLSSVLFLSCRNSFFYCSATVSTVMNIISDDLNVSCLKSHRFSFEIVVTRVSEHALIRSQRMKRRSASNYSIKHSYQSNSDKHCFYLPLVTKRWHRRLWILLAVGKRDSVPLRWPFGPVRVVTELYYSLIILNYFQDDFSYFHVNFSF